MMLNFKCSWQLVYYSYLVILLSTVHHDFLDFLFISTVVLFLFFQVWLVGEKIGEGTGRTRKEAQHQAAEISLKNLASEFFFWQEKLGQFAIFR